ncbi:hypothetical protein H6P81_010565 [Aristolochia fimbriata]|uniref:Uncharacterized protein n=1 Tax=Aristolochia fimbriata TaxID=158543 RepID=A0AAV7EP44_ARIFI|nr:hypothetical protein H6P81_010565 [Aristolochia fimbriata]
MWWPTGRPLHVALLWLGLLYAHASHRIVAVAAASSSQPAASDTGSPGKPLEMSRSLEALSNFFSSFNIKYVFGHVHSSVNTCMSLYVTCQGLIPLGLLTNVQKQYRLGIGLANADYDNYKGGGGPSPPEHLWGPMRFVRGQWEIGRLGVEVHVHMSVPREQGKGHVIREKNEKKQGRGKRSYSELRQRRRVWKGPVSVPHCFSGGERKREKKIESERVRGRGLSPDFFFFFFKGMEMQGGPLTWTMISVRRNSAEKNLGLLDQWRETGGRVQKQKEESQETGVGHGLGSCGKTLGVLRGVPKI